MKAAVKSAQLSAELTLPYAEQGDPAGIPVVLLHGYSDSRHSYDLLFERLPDHVHAFAPTQRGHGDADRPAGGYDAATMTADVARFMDAVGLEKAIVVGHSGGSYTAQRFAVEHPERTPGVVLLGAFLRFDDNPAIDELWSAVSELSDPVDPAFVREFQESTACRPVPADFLETIIAESLKMPARVWQAALRGFLDAEPPTRLGAIAAPALILWGDRDELCPRADQEALAAAIPGARVETYAGTGHAPHWEQPERAAGDVVAFAEAIAREPALSPLPR